MIGYIAKDKNGEIYLYFHTSPFKTYVYWSPSHDDGYIELNEEDLPKGINPKWEDNEPIKVNINFEKI